MKRSISKSTLAAALSSAAVLAVPAVWLATVRTGPRPDRAPLHAAARPAAAQPAQSPTPSQAQPQRQPPGPGAKSAQPGGVPRTQRPGDLRPVNAREWRAIDEFMSEFMPFRMAEVEKMPDGPTKERVKRLLANRYRGLRLLQSRDPQSYEARLGQLRLEDEVYKLVSQLPGADLDRRQRIRDELRVQVEKLVDVDLHERKRRVEWLETEAARLKKLLEQDTAERDSLVDRRVGRFLDWGSRWPAQRPAAPGNAAGPATADAPNGPAGRSKGSATNQPAGPADPSDETGVDDDADR